MRALTEGRQVQQVVPLDQRDQLARQERGATCLVRLVQLDKRALSVRLAQPGRREPRVTRVQLARLDRQGLRDPQEYPDLQATPGQPDRLGRRDQPDPLE